MHTPGPWTVDPKTLAVYAPDRHGHAAAVRAAECGRTLLPADEIRANAALVAAAPDLLAALQAWLASDRADQSIIAGHDVDGHPLNAAGVARVKARAAIARATGR